MKRRRLFFSRPGKDKRLVVFIAIAVLHYMQ